MASLKNNIRYIITGGDNGYCARCGGLGDRVLLRVDDEDRSYKMFYRAPSCLGKHCWREQELYGGRAIVRGKLVKDEQGERIVYQWLDPSKNKIYIVQTNGTELEYIPVVVKNNKYGKDGEFGDKLDAYTYKGYVEPDDVVERWRQEDREALERYYNNMKNKEER